jgi:hypothetical protein
MIAIRRSLLTALALTAGSALALGLPAAAGAAPNPTALPQYIIHFTAIALPAATTTGLQFRSTSCAITPATNPIVATCKETGTIKFATAGGSGSASVSSPLAGINWRFTLVRSAATTDTYRMVGNGTESMGATPILRPVKVTGTLTVEPTSAQTIKGTENVYPKLRPTA